MKFARLPLERRGGIGYNAKVYASKPNGAVYHQDKREELITMSASSKKKLRKEQNAANMTQRQRAEQKEAKKLKVYTATFWIILGLCLCIVLGVVLKAPATSIAARLTTAVVVGEHKLTAVELNYFYIDTINEYCNQYSSWLSYLLDTSKPLNEQVIDKETGETWADNFVDMALNNAKNTYALYDAAVAAGHEFSEEEKASMNQLYASMDTVSKDKGYGSASAYLKAVYGNGASEKSYKEYYEITCLASSYYNAYSKELKDSYTDADLREFEKDKFDNYSSFSYAYHYMTVEDFLTGGTKGEDGKITYSDAEKKAAEEALKKAAEELAVEGNNTVSKLNEAIEKLEHSMEEAEKEDSKAETKTGETDKTEEKDEHKDCKHDTCTEKKADLYTSINSVLQEWLANKDRKLGDITALPYTTTSGEGEDKVETLKGYYVVIFQERDDNKFGLVDVRHVLVPFEGGTTNKTTGQTTYSDAEKKAAKEKAEKLFKEWKDGKATEDTFAEMANKHSTDGGSNTNGGLYEDVYPGQMVTNFNDFCFDKDRKAGDTDIVESNYGYHIMYYVGESETLYRDYMITNDLLAEEIDEWQTALNDAMTLEEKNTKFIDGSITLNGGVSSSTSHAGHNH